LMGTTDCSFPISPIEAEGIDETDGFEGDIESMGEEDEPPDTQHNINSGEGRITKDAQPSENDQAQPPHPLEGTRRGTTRSGRSIKITQRACESNLQRGQEWLAWIASETSQPELLDKDEIYELFSHREYDVQDRASDPISFLATSN
jgi:hypothetical protein